MYILVFSVEGSFFSKQYCLNFSSRIYTYKCVKRNRILEFVIFRLLLGSARPSCSAVSSLQLNFTLLFGSHNSSILWVITVKRISGRRHIDYLNHTFYLFCDYIFQVMIFSIIGVWVRELYIGNGPIAFHISICISFSKITEFSI